MILCRVRTEEHTKSRNYFLKEGRKSAGASPDHMELGTAGLDFSVPVSPSVTNLHITKHSTYSGEEHMQSRDHHVFTVLFS